MAARAMRQLAPACPYPPGESDIMMWCHRIPSDVKTPAPLSFKTSLPSGLTIHLSAACWWLKGLTLYVGRCKESVICCQAHLKLPGPSGPSAS